MTSEKKIVEELKHPRIRRSWFWAGFRRGLSLCLLPRVTQCEALSSEHLYCQMAQGHYGRHHDCWGGEWT